jgi:hypothetical protein
MAATTVDRQTLSKRIERILSFTVAAGQTIPAGVMVATTAAGEAVNASDAAAIFVQGRAQHRAVAGEIIEVARGVFAWANNGSVVKADIGKVATVVDNQTVGLAAQTTADIGAGIIDNVDADGVWVAMTGGRVDAT